MHFIRRKEQKNSCLNRVRDNNLEKIATDLKAIMATDSEDKPDKIRELGEKYWKKLRSGCKKSVRQHMLREQDYLCAYCERKIENEIDAHIEHIKPKSRYLENGFDYHNLIVSCNGNQCSEVNQEEYEDEIHSCGHSKDNDFDEEKFLNPVELIIRFVEVVESDTTALNRLETEQIALALLKKSHIENKEWIKGDHAGSPIRNSETINLQFIL
jgi:uncharacterized protein (TIGR02646 family)